MFNRPPSAGIAATSVAPSSDADLVRRARLGDVGSFDALVTGRLDRCYRLAWSILLNESDAADAIQEGLLSAWTQLPGLRDPSAFDGWLNRIVANAARMGRRRRGRVREVPVEILGPQDPDGEIGPDRRLADPVPRPDPEGLAQRDLIGRAFDRLRPDERAILALHHVDERPIAEIARTLGIPAGTAKWRLHAARRALERAMEAEHA